MASVILREKPTGTALIERMARDAAFEVSGDSDAEQTALICAGRIHASARVAKVPKLCLAGRCAFNCAYCALRASRDDKAPYALEPRALAQIAVEQAEKNGRGVFLSSAILKDADYTQEKLAETARIMREDLFYGGYIHAKVMPGADPALIARTGTYASRLSVNIEVANSAGYQRVAKQKSRALILSPMRAISNQIRAAGAENRRFARSQTTQLMAGAIGEDDRTILTLSKALYATYGLKRVYYTAFGYAHEAKGYPELPLMQTPLWRVARLYQADRLIALYGFSPDEVTPEDAAMLEEEIDPKSAWALRHLSLYPVEVNTADFETLLRVPGIGLISAQRILEARRYIKITHETMRKLHISLKRCSAFITCAGRYQGGRLLDSPGLRTALSTGGKTTSIARTVSAGGN